MSEITVMQALDKISGAIKEYIDETTISEDDIAQATDAEVVTMLAEILNNE